MGVVYKAEDTKLKRIVALKFLPPELTRDEVAKQRFIQEAQAASALQHPTICTIHDVDQSADGQLFISMDCYEGETLKDRINRGQLSVDDAVDITVQIAKGLQRAHEKEIVHRDIKPANIFVTTDGFVKILDFGLAKLARQTRLTVSGGTVGTIAYMSPEQARGDEVDQRTDIWSLGVVLYEMLSGKVPFAGEFEQAIVYSILNEEAKPLPDDVPAELRTIVTKALAKDPEQRYQSLDEMLKDFEPLSREAAQYGELTLSRFVRRALRKRRTRYAAISIAATLLVLIAFFLARPMIFPEATRADLPSIAVVSFENETGDGQYDAWRRGISLLLATKLDQSGALRVTTWERISDLLKQMDKTGVQNVDADLGFEICVKEGVQMMAVGSILKAGETFSITVRIFDVDTRELLASVSSRGNGEESILDTQVDQLAQDLSIKIGVPDTARAKMQTSITQLSTASPEAYKLYLQAMGTKLYSKEGVALFKRVLAIDSTFAMAYFNLARYTQDRSLRKAYFDKAFALRHRAPDHQRFLLSFWYFNFRRDSNGVDSVTTLWVRRYPRDREAHFWRGFYLQFGAKDYAAAVVEYERAAELSETLGSLTNAGYCYAELRQFDKAIATYRRILEKDETKEEYDRANIFDSMGEVYLYKGDLQNAIANFKEAYYADSSKGRKNGVGMNSSAALVAFSSAKAEDYQQALYWFGKIEQPLLKNQFIRILRTLCGQYKQLASEIPPLKSFAESEDAKTGAYDEQRWLSLDLAWMYYEKGDTVASHRYLQKAKSYPWINVERPSGRIASIAIHMLEGLRFLETGEIDSVRQCISVLDSLVNDKEVVTFKIATVPYQSAFLQARILEKEGRLDEAIALLRGTTFSNNHRIPRISQFPFIDDVLARLLIKKGDIDGAIAEYERMTGPNLLNRNQRWIDSRYHYKLAKLYEQKGWPGRAVEQYQRFLKVWEVADQDIPEIIDAKRKLKTLLNKN